MASQADLDFTYSTIDKIFRLSFGEEADFSGAMYNGDFSMSLEEAQGVKHKFIADSLNIQAGSRVLDLGCGWGPLLAYYTKDRNATALGVTLSRGQAASCRKNGFDVVIKDCLKITANEFGTFDGISSVGAFEHFCSVNDYTQGNQEKVYDSFFKNVAGMLPAGGRFFLQTMTFSKNMIELGEEDINAPKGSPKYLIALMMKQFPGSWLPYGFEMIEKTAAPYFRVVTYSSGRLDYIETIRQWRRKFHKFNFRKYLIYLSLIPKLFYDPEFKYRKSVFMENPNKSCFEQEIMDHYRIVFEKK